MGHWSERLVEEAAARLRLAEDADRGLLKAMLRKAGADIEILAGRSFGFVADATVNIPAQPLPFVDIPDLNIGTMKATAEVWPIPDPSNQSLASVMQLATFESRGSVATVPFGEALWVAGQLVAQAHHNGILSRDYVIDWLGRAVAPDQRMSVLRSVIDQSARFNVPLVGVSLGDWWIQLGRRLLWATPDTPDEGRLLEFLFDPPDEKQPMLLVAGEPILILARVSENPSRLAISARVWTEDVRVPSDRPWPALARTVHGHGIPVLSVDAESSPDETGCQLLLLAYWHKYIDKNEPRLVQAIARAYPGPVRRVLSKTDAPDILSAAGALLGELVQPGFDPARGAASTRRYVNRKASIVVMKYRKTTRVGPDPWERVGVTERRYYKLLPKFSLKVGGRYRVDDEVLERMVVDVDARERRHSRRGAAIELLMRQGLTYAAARKRIQRHGVEGAAAAALARPRRSATKSHKV